MEEEKKEAEVVVDQSRAEAARKAYNDKDVEASIAIHNSLPADEKHSKAGENVKSIVFGGMDGIITTLAHISGAAGGNLTVPQIVIIGISNLIADALAMGLGDSLSTKAENEYIMKERAREAWEYEVNPKGELDEMIEIYQEKGMSKEDAEKLVTLNSKYKEFFIDSMMVQELGLSVPDPEDSVWKEGLITFLSFIGFGIVPMLGYIILPAALQNVPLDTQTHNNILFGASFGLTALTLFGLGVFQAQFTIKSWYRSGFEIMFFGMFCGAASYGIGVAVAQGLPAGSTGTILS